MSKKRDRIVYSTDPDFDKRCPECGQYPCECPEPSYPPLSKQTAYLRRERRRGNKMVTVIDNLELSPDDMDDLATRLKQLCGAGGTVKEGTIEIQGDHRDRIADELKGMGAKTKMAGG